MSTIYIHIDNLYVSELNVRKCIKENYIQELAENIKENGLIHPLTVQFNEQPNNKNKKYEIIAGQCRYEAFKILAKDDKSYTTINCNCLENKTNNQLQILSLVENVQRSNMRLKDKIRAYNKIYNSIDGECKYKLTQTKKYTGSTYDTINKYLKVNVLSDEILDRLDKYDQNKITLDVVCVLVDIFNKNISFNMTEEDLINILNELTCVSNNIKNDILTKYKNQNKSSILFGIQKERDILKNSLYKNIQSLKPITNENLKEIKKIYLNLREIIKCEINNQTNTKELLEINDTESHTQYENIIQKIKELKNEQNMINQSINNLKPDLESESISDSDQVSESDSGPDKPKPIFITTTQTVRNPELQYEFRTKLIDRYDKCIITDMDNEVCEAAHIIPFSESPNFDIDNGILLNLILHKLFDDYVWSINPDTLRIVVSDGGLKYDILKNNRKKHIERLENHRLTLDSIKIHFLKFN